MHRDPIGRPMEILLVEDSLVSAKLTIGALKKSGLEHRLSWSKDGQDAKEFVFHEKRYSRAPAPDLILLDLGLPRLGGRELLAVIRQSAELRGIPVVIMTGEPGEEGAKEFESLDVQGFLVKPINTDEFLKLVFELKQFWKEDMILPEPH